MPDATATEAPCGASSAAPADPTQGGTRRAPAGAAARHERDADAAAQAPTRPRRRGTGELPGKVAGGRARRRRPRPPDPILPTPFELALILGWWAVFALVLTGQHLMYYAAAGATPSLSSALARAFFGGAVWAVITVAAFTASRAFRIERPLSPQVLVHVLVGAALAAGEVVATHTVGRAAGWYDVTLSALILQAFPTNLLSYWLIVGVAHAFEYYRRFRRRASHAAHLNTRLARAELHLLKRQLHPHFLFNTLNAVATLVRTDPQRAERMIARLSDLLRAALDHAAAEEVSLAEELRFLDSYVEIERARLGDRLRFEVDVEQGVEAAMVPHLILQPLVENAVRHAVAPRVAGGRIRVRVARLDDTLRMDVRDDGPGLAATGTSGSGLGLANTRARLRQLYGRRYRYRAGDAAGGGFQVALEIPFRTAPTDPEESP